MSVYHQMGHHSENLVSAEHLGRYTGAILSPVNYDQQSIVSQLREFERIDDFDTIFDPQLYFPNTERDCLREWSYFPQDLDTADLSSEAWWDRINQGLLIVASEIQPDAMCAPAVVARTYTDAYYALTVNVGNRLATMLRDVGTRAVLTAIVSLPDLATRGRAEGIASILSRSDVDEVFLVIASEVEPRREIVASEELTGAMRLIAALETSGMRVIVGFSSTDMVLWKEAGASACATGKFFNLRRFTRSRFEEPSGGGGQLPYWAEEALLAYLREPDLLRISEIGMLSAQVERNPFALQILQSLRENPGTAWLGLSWRQYLYWFADLEARISAGEVRPAEYLRTVARNWERIEDEGIIMEESRNDGRWIQPWRRAISDFRRGR
jgi:hypothetical protein